MSQTFRKRCVGSSVDKRTNRWKLTCPECCKEHEPRTTLLARSPEECPHCGYQAWVDYNDKVEVPA